MAGALSGAHLGVAGVPAKWIEELERGPQGLDYLRTMADGLWRLHNRLAVAADAAGFGTAQCPIKRLGQPGDAGIESIDEVTLVDFGRPDEGLDKNLVVDPVKPPVREPPLVQAASDRA